MKPAESPVVTTMAQLALYAIQLLGLWLLLRGHQEPGGGFAGGMLFAAAVVLQGLVFGLRIVKDLLPIPFHWLIGSGLAFAAGTTLVPVFFGRPFLKMSFGYIKLPFFGSPEWSTAAIFDLGVFLVVLGATKVILLTISEARIRTGGEES